jgi:predicted ATPase
LGWSYELLSECERVVLRRLSTFSGRFNLEAASAVAAGGDIDVRTLIDCVSNLVSKSLVTAHSADAATRYSLLSTTRAYAREKLNASGELDEIARRHAVYVSPPAKVQILKTQKRSTHLSSSVATTPHSAIASNVRSASFARA